MSFALDAQDHPHIVYGDGDLHYVTITNGFWTFTTIDTTGDTGYEPCIALNPQGEPQVCCWMNGTNDLKLAKSSGGTWTVTTVDPGIGFGPSLKVDALGRSRVAYYANGGYDRLNFAAEDGAAWNIEMVATPAYKGSLALDGQGAPHVALQDGDNAHLKYGSLAP